MPARGSTYISLLFATRGVQPRGSNSADKTKRRAAVIERDQHLPIRFFHLVIEFERYEMDQLVDHCSEK